MYPEIPLLLSLVFMAIGLCLLYWSADRFVDGSAALAKLCGISPFVIGMVVIGFGTSAPELCVSVLSGVSGHSDLSLGNAYGSNIFNIAIILGIAALIRPTLVRPPVTFVAVPVLVGISIFSCCLVATGKDFTRMDGFLELAVFAVILPLYCWFDQKTKAAPPKDELPPKMSAGRAAFWIVLGLLLLVGSSHILVWGAVDFARACGVSELVIGLTIVAVGTSLPELASAIVSARRGEDEFVLGNIIGSNFFNTLAVVGIAGSLSPFKNFSPSILTRDLPLMIGLSASIAIFGFNFRNPRANGRVNRLEGACWILSYLVYLVVMICQEVPKGN